MLTTHCIGQVQIALRGVQRAPFISVTRVILLESSWNVMAHGDARDGKWRGNWRMVWVASTLHTTSERGVSSITATDAHTSVATSRLNWRTRRFKWTRPFRRKTKSGSCACAITFQTQSTWCLVWLHPSMSDTIRALSCCHIHLRTDTSSVRNTGLILSAYHTTDKGQKPNDPELSVLSSDPFRKCCIIWLVFICSGSVGTLRIPCVNTVDTDIDKDKVVPAHTAKGSGGTAPFILTSTLVVCRWSTSHPGRFIPRKRTAVPIE
jgi:hypothetical protein